MSLLVLGGGIWFEEHPCDQILVTSLWILVHTAVEVIGGELEWVGSLGSHGWSCVVVGGKTDGSHMDDWEALEEVLSDLLIKASLLPTGSLEVETMHQYSLRWSSDVLLDSSRLISDDLLKWFIPLLNSIKRPLALCVLPGDFLKSTSQESLLVVEGSKPEAWRPSLVQPGVELGVSVVKTSDPATEGW